MTYSLNLTLITAARLGALLVGYRLIPYYAEAPSKTAYSRPPMI